MSKKQTKLENLNRTAHFLELMLIKGIRTDDIRRRRPATIEDVNEYLMKSGFGVKGTGTAPVEQFINSLNASKTTFQPGYFGVGGGGGGQAQHFANQALYNWGAEMGGLKDKLLNPDSDLIENIRNRRVALDLYALQKPKEAFLAGAAGGLTTLPAGVAAETKLVQSGITPAWATGLVGAGEGLVFGAGQGGGDLWDRFINSLTTAALMGPTAYFGHKLIEAFSGLKQGMGKMLGAGGEEEGARMFVKDVRQDVDPVFERPYQTVDAVVEELRRRRSVAPGSTPVFADAGEESRLTAQSVIEGMSETKRPEALKVLNQRQLGRRREPTLQRTGGQADRISEGFERGTGIPEGNLYKDINRLQEDTRTKARDAYNAAYYYGDPKNKIPETLNDPEINDIMSLDDYQQAYREGFAINQIEKRTDLEAPDLRPPPGNPNEILQPPYSVAELDYTSRGMRDVMTSATATQGLKPQRFRAQSKDLAAFLDKIDLRVPEFGNARKTYAIGKHAEDAMLEGQKIFRKEPKFIASEIDEMTTGEREYYKIGAAQAVYTFMESKGLGRNVAQLVDEYPATLKRFEIIFGNQSGFRQFMDQLIVEAEGAKTRRFIGNSQTARITKRQEQIAGGTAVEDIAADLITAPLAPTQAARTTLMRTKGINPFRKKGKQRAADYLADIYFETDPTKQALKAQAAERLANRAAVKRGHFRAGGGLLGPRMYQALQSEYESRIK